MGDGYLPLGSGWFRDLPEELGNGAGLLESSLKLMCQEDGKNSSRSSDKTGANYPDALAPWAMCCFHSTPAPPHPSSPHEGSLCWKGREAPAGLEFSKLGPGNCPAIVSNPNLTLMGLKTKSTFLPMLRERGIQPRSPPPPHPATCQPQGQVCVLTHMAPHASTDTRVYPF